MPIANCLPEHYFLGIVFSYIVINAFGILYEIFFQRKKLYIKGVKNFIFYTVSS